MTLAVKKGIFVIFELIFFIRKRRKSPNSPYQQNQCVAKRRINQLKNPRVSRFILIIRWNPSLLLHLYSKIPKCFYRYVFFQDSIKKKCIFRHFMKWIERPVFVFWSQISNHKHFISKQEIKWWKISGSIYLFLTKFNYLVNFLS